MERLRETRSKERPELSRSGDQFVLLTKRRRLRAQLLIMGTTVIVLAAMTALLGTALWLRNSIFYDTIF
jgi:hypothetical protein